MLIIFYFYYFCLSVQLYQYSTQLFDYELFLVGYMGYTFEEIASTIHNTSDYKSCVLKMLSLWRCKDGKVKTIKELLSALEMVPYLPIGVVKIAVNSNLRLTGVGCGNESVMII